MRTTASRARALGLDWEKVTALSDDALEERLYGPRSAKRAGRPLPDPAYLHVELRRVGVTLQLLHLEYLEQHSNGFRYTAFCAHYNEWLARQKLTMRQVHRAGEKLFVDYSGKKPRIVDAQTGEVTEVELFVAVLGASNFTYAEATRTQTVTDWIGSHVRALHDLGGVPKARLRIEARRIHGRSDHREPLALWATCAPRTSRAGRRSVTTRGHRVEHWCCGAPARSGRQYVGTKVGRSLPRVHRVLERPARLAPDLVLPQCETRANPPGCPMGSRATARSS
jgi:hypothetical protein